MPFSFHVDEDARVFHVEAFGEVNDMELMDLSTILRKEAAFFSGFPVLCDCSALTTVSVSSGVIEVLAKAARSRTNFLAIVAPLAVAFGLARMYQIISDPDDLRIHVFTRVEDAMAWLEPGVRGLTLHAGG